MKKKTSILLLATLLSLNAFSQEKDKLGLNLEAGVISEYASDGMRGFQLFATPTYQLNDRTDLGIGTGLKFFRNYSDVPFTTAFPLYASAMYRFKSAGITPFVEGKLGYTFFKDTKSGTWVYPSFPWSDAYYPTPDPVKYRTKTRGGIFFSPSFGFIFPLKNKHALSASLAYSFDRTSAKNELFYPTGTQKGSFKFKHHSIALRVGYSF
jgi:hypothetical protein